MVWSASASGSADDSLLASASASRARAVAPSRSPLPCATSASRRTRPPNSIVSVSAPRRGGCAAARAGHSRPGLHHMVLIEPHRAPTRLPFSPSAA